MQNCYSDACDTFRAAWTECETSSCRYDAWGVYLLAIGDCILESQSERDTWITLWQLNGEFGFTYDNIVPIGAASYDF